MIPPRPVDVQVPRAHALLPESEFLHHSATRGVFRPNADLDSVQSDRTEAVVGGERYGCRYHTAAGDRLIHPVTDMAGTHRTPCDPRNRQLARQKPLVLDHEGQHPARLCLRTQMTDHLPERRAARREMAWQRRRNGRFPWAQPVAVALVHLSPRALVAQPYGTEGGGAVRELDRPERVQSASPAG
jgi:hypothetical protein